MMTDRTLVGVMIEVTGQFAAGNLVLVVDVRLVVDLVDFQITAGVQIVAGDFGGQRAAAAAAAAGQFVGDHFVGGVRRTMMVGRVEQVAAAKLVERIEQHFGSLRTRTDQFGILVQALLFLQQKIVDSQLMLLVRRLLRR